MKKYFHWVFALLLFGCTQNDKENKPTLDITAELQSIETTRNGFCLAIKEKRYQDLANWSTPDLIQVVPGDANWGKMYAMRGKLGLFPYDSIVMKPIETRVLNDSIAYDFGVSRVYYADSIGEIHQLQDTYLALLKKDKEGRWRLHREVASSNILDKN